MSDIIQHMENRARHLRPLADQHKHIVEMEKQLPSMVAAARLAGCSWAAIGSCLGITRQLAHARFRDVDSEAGTPED